MEGLVDRAVLLDTECTDFSGMLWFKYRGYVVVRDALTEGGRYYLEDCSADAEIGPADPSVTYDTLGNVCALIDAMHSLRHIWADYFRQESQPVQHAS